MKELFEKRRQIDKELLRVALDMFKNPTETGDKILKQLQGQKEEIDKQLDLYLK